MREEKQPWPESGLTKVLEGLIEGNLHQVARVGPKARLKKMGSNAALGIPGPPIGPTRTFSVPLSRAPYLTKVPKMLTKISGSPQSTAINGADTRDDKQ